MGCVINITRSPIYERHRAKVLSAEISELFLRAHDAESNNDFPEALETYNKILALDPHHVASHINTGTILFQKKLFQQAAHHYRNAVLSDPNYALAHFDLAITLDELGEKKAAIREYRLAIQQNADYADAHYNLALDYHQSTNPAEIRLAILHFAKYVELDKQGPYHDFAKRRLNELRKQDYLRLVPNAELSA